MALRKGVYPKVKKVYTLSDETLVNKRVLTLECGHAIMRPGHKSPEDSESVWCFLCTQEKHRTDGARAKPTNPVVDDLIAQSMGKVATSLDVVLKKLSDLDARLTQVEDAKTTPYVKPAELDDQYPGHGAG